MNKLLNNLITIRDKLTEFGEKIETNPCNENCPCSASSYERLYCILFFRADKLFIQMKNLYYDKTCRHGRIKLNMINDSHDLISTLLYPETCLRKRSMITNEVKFSVSLLEELIEIVECQGGK